MKRKVLIVAIMFVFGLAGLQAQNTIPATGGNANGSGGSVNYSVGQLVYNSYEGANGSAAQGVQQPYEISVVAGIEKAVGISLEILVYPNPTTDFICLKIEDYKAQKLSYQLYDSNGSLILDQKISRNETSIVMNHFAPAIYFLKVTDNKEVVKTFKIIKN